MKQETKCYCGHTTRCDCGPETLEKAAERIYPMVSNEYLWHVPIQTRKIFIEGAKWQQERSYSEEEVLRIITSCKEYLSFGDEFNEKEWFEQFKKK